MGRAVQEALLIPGRSTQAILLNRVPIPNVLDRYHSARISVCLPPSVLSRDLATSIDTLLVEILGALTPLDDRETLDGRTSTKLLAFILGGLEGLLDRLSELR